MSTSASSDLNTPATRREQTIVEERKASSASSTPLERLRVEQHEETFVVSDRGTGALSALSAGELTALHAYCTFPGDPSRARRSAALVLEQLGCQPADAATVVDRLERDGWNRTGFPHLAEQPLSAVYFTVTRDCNLACPYCYQGQAGRNTHMSIADAELFLDKIRAVNAQCQICISGGEPFLHPQVSEILALVAARHFPLVVLTNGTCLSDVAIAKLRELPEFRYVQLSIDGSTREKNELTRGAGSFKRVMNTFERVVRAGLPFVLAPTLHSGNLDDLPHIAAMAIENGGWWSPNNLRLMPPTRHAANLELTAEQCLTALAEANRLLLERFDEERLTAVADRYGGASCGAAIPNANFRCGIGYSLLDVDWNGDVHPCHLAKDSELILGNLRHDEFETIFQRALERGMRVCSYEIEKCSQCTFMSTCGGGCKAAAWYAYGSMRREDDQCELIYRASLARLLRRGA